MSKLNKNNGVREDDGSGVSRGMSKAKFVMWMTFLVGLLGACSATQTREEPRKPDYPVYNLPAEGVYLLREYMQDGCGFFEEDVNFVPINIYVQGLIDQRRFEEAEAMLTAIDVLRSDEWMKEYPNVHSIKECNSVRGGVQCQLANACGDVCELVPVEGWGHQQARYDGAKPESYFDRIGIELFDRTADKDRKKAGKSGGPFIRGDRWNHYYEDGGFNGMYYSGAVASEIMKGLEGEGSFKNLSSTRIKDVIASAVVDDNVDCWKKAATAPEIEKFVAAEVKRVLDNSLGFYKSLKDTAPVRSRGRR